MIRLRSIAGGFVCALSIWCTQAMALEVIYKSVDLADSVPGTDRWRYDYTLIGSLGEFEGVNLLFDPATRGALQIVTPADPGALGMFIDQPNPALQADGLVIVSAVRPIVNERLTFAIAFDRLSGGVPADQPYEVFDANFTLVGAGVTTPVPEPATAALFLAALAMLAPMLRRRFVANG